MEQHSHDLERAQRRALHSSIPLSTSHFLSLIPLSVSHSTFYLPSFTGGAIYEQEDEYEDDYTTPLPAIIAPPPQQQAAPFRPQRPVPAPAPAPPASKPPQMGGFQLPALKSNWGGQAQGQAQREVLALDNAVGNMYGGYSKGPPNMAPKPAAQSPPGGGYRNADERPWYVKEARNNISESHAAYGAFYNGPSGAAAAAAAAEARALQLAIQAVGDQRQQYKGLYVPAGQQPQYYNGAGANARNWPGAKLQPVQYGGQYGRQQPQQQQGGGISPHAALQRAAAAGGGGGGGGGGAWKPPPWNYGGYKAPPARNVAAGGGGGAAGMPGALISVARYPPIEWQAPRMR